MSIAAVMAGLPYTGVTVRCVIKRIRLFGTLVLDSKLRQNQTPTSHLQPTSAERSNARTAISRSFMPLSWIGSARRLLVPNRQQETKIWQQ